MIVNLKSQTDLSGFYIVYEGSTNLEKPGWYGISHLLEHLCCKAFDHLQEEFDRDSIDWNAYTSANEIVFYMTGLEEKVNKWKYNLVDFTKRDSDRKIIMGDYDAPLELNNDFKGKCSIAMLSPVIDEDFGYVNYINSMLSVGLKSPLYQEVREKRGLVYSIHCYLSRVNKQSVNTIATQTSDKNFDTLVGVVGDVINSPDKYLTKERFDIINDFYKVRKVKKEILRYGSVNEWIDPKGWSVYDILDTVNYDKIREVYDNHFNFDNFHISNDKTEFNK